MMWITTTDAATSTSTYVYSVHKLIQKYRRQKLRLLRRKEYNRLRAMVPSIATKPKVSKVTVIEEAIKYIDQLHCALITRLQTRGLPQALQGLVLPGDIHHIGHSEIKELVRHMLPSSQRQSTPSTTTVTVSSTSSPSPTSSTSSSPSSSTSTTLPLSSSTTVTRERNRHVASYLQRAQKRPKWPRH